MVSFLLAYSLLKEIIGYLRRCGYDFRRLEPKQIGTTLRDTTVQLHAYQHILPQIQELRASLVAISPQTPDHTLSMVEKQQLAFPVLSDLGNTVARRYRLVFSVPDTTRLIYQQKFGINLPAFNGDDSWELPIPGTFLLDQQAKVRLAFVDVDYTHRLEPSALLEGLRELAGQQEE